MKFHPNIKFAAPAFLLGSLSFLCAIIPESRELQIILMGFGSLCFGFVGGITVLTDSNDNENPEQ